MREIVNPIYQGADQDITLVTKDSDGSLYDFSGADRLVVVVYYQGNEVLQKYSMNASAGWKTLDVTNAADGELSFKLQTSDTKNAKAGKIYAEIRAQFPDVDYDDNYFDLLGRDIYLGEIVESASGNLTLPS